MHLIICCECYLMRLVLRDLPVRFQAQVIDFLGSVLNWFQLVQLVILRLLIELVAFIGHERLTIVMLQWLVTFIWLMDHLIIVLDGERHRFHFWVHLVQVGFLHLLSIRYPFILSIIMLLRFDLALEGLKINILGKGRCIQGFVLGSLR
jgi:hypothetical protein